MTTREFTSVLFAEIEKRLVDAITKIEGRAPTLEEAKEHGHRMIYPDGKQEYKWKGTTVVIVHPPSFNSKSHIWTHSISW